MTPACESGPASSTTSAPHTVSTALSAGVVMVTTSTSPGVTDQRAHGMVLEVSP
jgi:hypothetical protein